MLINGSDGLTDITFCNLPIFKLHAITLSQLAFKPCMVSAVRGLQ